MMLVIIVRKQEAHRMAHCATRCVGYCRK